MEKKAKKLKERSMGLASLTFPQNQEMLFVSSWNKKSLPKESTRVRFDNYEAKNEAMDLCEKGVHRTKHLYLQALIHS